MNKEKSQLIGIILLSLILVTYLQYFGTKPSTPRTPSTTTEATIKENPTTQIKKLVQLPPLNNDHNTPPLVIENEDICVWLDQKGGMIKKVVLKKYKGNKQDPLTLLEVNNSHMTWILSTQNGIINTQNLDFTVEKHNNQVNFTYILDATKQQQIKYTYTLPQKGYTLDYKVDITGFNMNTDKAQLEWYHAPKNLEKDFKLNSSNTYVQYQSQNKGLKHLSKDKKAKLENIKWSAIKQRFFVSSIIAPKNTVFTQGELITQAARIEDKNTLMEVSMKLEIPLKNLDGNAHNFTFYFGPNAYSTLAKVAPGFEKNHYLGFTPIKYINKYIILPLADSLDTYTNHYVWVLLLLALFFKLLQLYFAYKDYIITLKQKALQPVLAKLKANYTDKQQAKLAEISFYTKMGLPPSSLFFKFFLGLMELPVFIAMIYFIPNNIALRQLSFLWTEDLSSADNLINFSFSIPLLGSHINLFALLMCVSSVLRSKKSNHQEPADQNTQLFKYILPIAMFLGFNRYASAFCLYRIFTNVISLLPSFLFKLLVNEKAHLAQLVEKSENIPVDSQKLPRALARLGKKNNK